MGNPEADFMQDSSSLVDLSVESKSAGNGGNRKKKKFQKVYCNKASPGNDSIVASAIAEAQKRVKRLERDCVHADKKYTEAKSELWGLFSEAYRSETCRRWFEYRVNDCNRLVEQLQKVLDKLSPKASSEGTKTTDHSLHFSMLHGNKSLAQESILLRQKTESQQQEDDDPTQENIDFKRINCELGHLQRTIPKYSKKKPIHDLLSEVKETKKSREKAIANDALDGNPTSHDHLTKSVRNEVKLLKKLIEELEKQRRETEQICRNAWQHVENAEKKKRRLEKKSEEQRRRWDEEKKHILKLKRQQNHKG